MNKNFTVSDEAAGTRLDLFVAAVSGMSRSAIQKLIKAGRVYYDGEPSVARQNVAAGHEIIIKYDVPVTVPARPALDLPIVYEDEDIIVVDKPAGLLVHPGNGRSTDPSVVDFSRSRVQDDDQLRPGIVHRLDRDTSGLLIIAKNPEAKRYMQEQFARRTVKKTYLLLAAGRVEPPEARITLPLDRDPRDPLRRAVVSGGRPAVTQYRTLAAYPGYTYLEAAPETGRTHQIRVHFSAIGHPVVGDRLYGRADQTLGLARHFLHAAALAFIAPSGQLVELVSPLPEELGQVLTRLEKVV